MKPLYGVFAFLLSLCGATLSSAAFQDVKGQVISYGPGKTSGETEIDGNPGSAIAIKRAAGFVIAEKTNIIPAKMGTQFVVEFKVSGLPANEIVKLRRVTTFPAMQLPDGKTLTEFKSEFQLLTTADGTLSTFIGWIFTDESELVPGNWRTEIWYQDKKLLEKWFRVVSDPAKKVADGERANKDAPPKLSAMDFAAFWTDLASPEYDKADNAWRKIAAAGDNATSFLRQNIRKTAVLKADLKAVDKLVADLGSDDFATRERASKQLTALGEVTIVPLLRMLEKNPQAEAKERGNLLLKNFGEPVLTGEGQRALVAVELLEVARTAQAISLLEEVERDALVPQIRSEARDALRRIGLAQKK